MNQIPKKIGQTLWVLTVVGLGFMVLSCASNNYQAKQLADTDTEKLKDLWVEASNFNERYTIVQEFERRKSTDGLLFCLFWATRKQYSKSAPGQTHPWSSSGYKYYPGEGYGKPSLKLKSIFLKREAIEIVHVLGKLEDPKSIPSLKQAVLYSKDTEFKTAVINTLQKFDSPEAASAIIQSLKDPDPIIRFQALDIVGNSKSSEAMESVLPILLDKDADIRWKAVHTLGQIGDPRAADRIGFLLADPDESVRDIAGSVLKKLGIAEDKIADWKQKARHLSFDEVYHTKLAYQKAEFEKEELARQLKSEKDFKRQLEEALQNKETASGKQKDLIESLYEKERQLKSKQAQLDITLQQSEEYQSELQRLNAKVQSLNTELNQAKTLAATETVKHELDKTLAAKSKIEKETKSSQEKESTLREEIASLNTLAEKTRLEAEAAKNEVVACASLTAYFRFRAFLY